MNIIAQLPVSPFLVHCFIVLMFTKNMLMTSGSLQKAGVPTIRYKYDTVHLGPYMRSKADGSLGGPV